MTSRPSTAAPIMAVLAIGLVTLGAYVGGYFLVEDYWEMGNVGVIVRTYRHKWQAIVFQPAAWTESMLSGWTVETRAKLN
jgi:hypothetical protein